MKFLGLMVLSFILIFAFGCAQKSEPAVQEPSAPVVEQPKANITEAQPAPCSTGNVVQKDECYLSLAKSKSDPQICMNIYSTEKLDGCYAIFANSSLELCKKITDAGVKADCLTQNAKAQKSEGICSLIVNMDRQKACLANIVPRCMLLNIEERSLCTALEKKDYTACDSDACLQAYALNTSDSNACGRITRENERLYCMALVDKTVETCNQASIAAMRDWCAQHAAETLDNLDGCGIATSGTGYSNDCYLYFAVKRGNSTTCRKASPEERRDDCYTNYSIQTKTVDACSKVVESLNKIGCYYKAARMNYMPSLCNPLGIESQRRDCYSMSILNDVGPVASDCAGVDSLDWKDKCYGAAAGKSYNQTLCGFIRPGSDKDMCDSRFGS